MNLECSCIGSNRCILGAGAGICAETVPKIATGVNG